MWGLMSFWLVWEDAKQGFTLMEHDNQRVYSERGIDYDKGTRSIHEFKDEKMVTKHSESVKEEHS